MHNGKQGNDSDSEVEQPCRKKKPRGVCAIPSISASELRSGELSDSIPPLPPPMPSLSELQSNRQPSLQLPLPLPSPASVSVDLFPSLPSPIQKCEPLQLSTPFHDFDDDSCSPGFATSTPKLDGGYFPDFFPPMVDVPSQISNPAPLLPPENLVHPQQLKKPTHPQPCADLQPLEIPALSPKPTDTQPPSKKCRKNRLAMDVMFKRRRNKCRQYNLNPKKPIVVENYKPKSLKMPKTWIPELGLQQSDKEIVLSDTALLDDSIINAAQKLLKKANPAMPGLQDVTCGLTMSFDVEPGEFVQILHTGSGHWITVSNIGMKHAEVQVFDSMYKHVPTMVKAQIASLLATEEPAIKMNMMDVQMQSGGYDCGLFSIAFATALVFGEQPGQFLFDQKKMRAHLIQCLEVQQITPFPIMKRRRGAACLKVKVVEDIPVYCLCRMPELPDSFWVECSACKEWYHSNTCVKISGVFS